jgi:sirohydrochlorin cobaltochelatase
MKRILVLAVHGAPPNDFPADEMREFFALHGRRETAPAALGPALERRYAELEAKVRSWPRTARNDPFHAASNELAQALKTEVGLEVLVGFNEFCSPDLDEALARAVGEGADRVVVLTTMMTRGGEHAERDIAQAVSRARERHPGVEMVYAWPFETASIARFLAEHIRGFFA